MEWLHYEHGARAIAGDCHWRQQVVHERVRLLFRRGSAAYVASVFSAVMILYMLWGRASTQRLAAWVLFITFTAALRFFLSKRYFADPGAHTPWSWAHRFTWLAALNGVAWGTAAVIFWDPASLPGQLLLAIVLMGMVTGSAALSASYLPAFFAFAAPALLPVWAQLVLAPQRMQHGLAVMMTAFFIFLIQTARAGSRTVVEAASGRIRLEQLNRTLEHRIEERTSELTHALRTRDEFLALASHELRTPITSLKLQLQLLGRELAGARNERDRARMAVLDRQVNRLAALIGTLLDVSRLREGRLQLATRPTDLGRLVRDTTAELEADLRARRCPLYLVLQDEVIGNWDPARLQQIIVNLLVNAAKYGEGHPITVKVRGDEQRAALSVRDEGMGIAPDDQERIFGRYQRAAPSRQDGGLGLGLYVVDQLVRAMGGTVWVVSEPGNGAEFTVSLPRGEWGGDQRALQPEASP